MNENNASFVKYYSFFEYNGIIYTDEFEQWSSNNNTSMYPMALLSYVLFYVFLWQNKIKRRKN